MRPLLALVLTCAVLGCTATTPASSQDPTDRVDAVIEALSAGDPERYDAIARGNFTDAFYARSTREERASFVRRFHGDLGELDVLEMTETPDGIRARLRGETGMGSTLEFSFDAETGLISTFALQVGGPPPGGQAGGLQLPPAPINSAMSADAMQTALEGWLAPVFDHDDFSGVILVARNGAPFLTMEEGQADRSRNIPASATLAYNLASIGKRLTQTAIARLVQDGHLTRETRLGDVLPDYPNEDARTATIQQLLDHGGGISDFFGSEFAELDKAAFASNHDYYNYVSSLPQRFVPGSQTEYCNGCYVVLGEIIERVSGMPFERYIQEAIFDPAGMTASGYFRMDDPDAPIARSYTRLDGPGSAYVDAQEFHGVTGSAAGGVYASAMDLLAFDNALRNGVLLNAEQAALVLGGNQQADGRNTSAAMIAGGAAGVNTFMITDGEWGVFVLGNVDAPVPGLIANGIARALRG